MIKKHFNPLEYFLCIYFYTIKDGIFRAFSLQTPSFSLMMTDASFYNSAKSMLFLLIFDQSCFDSFQCIKHLLIVTVDT